MTSQPASKAAGIGSARAKFYFQILSTPTSDTPGTLLLLHFDNKRYLFGDLFEGAQRVCVQRGVGLKKVREIFLTGQTGWQSIGGLIGMILTMSDVQAMSDVQTEGTGDQSEERPRLNIHGGPLLAHAVACGRRFVFRTGMPLSVKEFEGRASKDVEEPSWTDENIEVWALPAYSSLSSDDRTVQSTGSVPGSVPGSPLNSSPQTSPKKRNHDQFTEMGDSGFEQFLDPEDQAIRQSIVSDMFESDWRRDKLIETTWAEVERPAVMFIRDPDTKSLIPFKFPANASIPPNQKVLVRKPWPASLRATLPPPPINFKKPRLSYIIRGYPQRGVFDPKKALALGIPKGPLFRQLAEGNSLKLDDGRNITPDMVLGPTKPGRGIAIIDISNTDYVESLLDRPEWQSQNIMTGIEAICWNLGPGVITHPRVQSFMQSLPTVKHIISSSDVCPDYLALESSAASAIRLSRISKEIFPVPVHDNQTLPQRGHPQSRQGNLPSPSLFRPAQRGLKIQVEPKFEFQEDEIVPWLNTAKVINEIPSKVHDLARKAREELGTETSQNLIGTYGNGVMNDHNPEIITLGTGSALPSKYRNVSATLLRFPGYGSYLFDCGENTLGQLSRVFDPTELRTVLRDLNFIWISHLHADHHLGTMGLLHACERARSESHATDKNLKKVYVASHVGMMDFLNDYSTVEKSMSVQQLICSASEPVKLNGKFFQYKDPGLHIKQIQTSRVRHCHGALAISVKFDNDFKFSYSGDCRPSANFAKIGINSDVLVHEATFDDGMEGDAMAKKHSTTGEALVVGSVMKAKNVILTHFSQRYQKIPVMSTIDLQKRVNFEDETYPSEMTDGPLDQMIGDSASLQEDQILLENISAPTDQKAALNLDVQDTSPQTPATQLPDTVLDPSAPNPSSSSPELPPEQAINGEQLPEMNVCVAFDYMRVRVSDIKHVAKFTPALMALFESEHPEILAGASDQLRNELINRSSLNSTSKKAKAKKDAAAARNGAVDPPPPAAAAAAASLKANNKAQKPLQKGNEKSAAPVPAAEREAEPARDVPQIIPYLPQGGVPEDLVMQQQPPPPSV